MFEDVWIIQPYHHVKLELSIAALVAKKMVFIVFPLARDIWPMGSLLQNRTSMDINQCTKYGPYGY